MNAEEGQKTCLSTLPLDIYDLIAEAVTAFPPVVSTSTLLSLCRVSRAWCAAAQPALFRNPFLPFGSPDTVPPRTYQRLYCLLDALHARPDLAACVKSFDLGRYTARCVAEVKVDRRLVSPLSILLVEACPNLRQMTSPFVVQSEKARFIEAMQQLSFLESFTLGEGLAIVDPWVVNVSIDIKDQWGTAVFTRADLATLAGKLPHLRCFHLKTRVRGFDHDEVIPWQLESFELSLLRNAKLSFPYLDKLLSNCRTISSLRRLVLKEHQVHPADLVQLIEAYGESLEVLETTTADHFTPNELLLTAISSSCPNLRRLLLATPVYNLPSALHTLSSLPRLRLLALDAVSQPLEQGAAGLAEQLRGFPSLTYLALTPANHGQTEDDMRRMESFMDEIFACSHLLDGEIDVVILPPL